MLFFTTTLRRYLGRTKMAFEEIDPRHHKFWLSVKFLKVYGKKNLDATILFVNFCWAFDSIHRGKMEQILLAYGLPKETITAIMILYKNMKVKSAPRMETQTTSILLYVCSKMTHEPHTYLDYVPRTSIYIMKDNGFKLAKERSRRYLAQTITDVDNTDDIALQAQSETLLHCLERTAAGIGLHVNADKTEYISYNQSGDISTLNGSSLKLVDNFTYIVSSVSLNEKDINTPLAKVGTAIDSLSVIWKSYLTDRIKRYWLHFTYL